MIETRILKSVIGFALIATAACAQGVDIPSDTTGAPSDAAVRVRVRLDGGDADFDAGGPPPRDAEGGVTSDEGDADEEGVEPDAQVSGDDGSELDAAEDDAAVDGGALEAGSVDESSEAGLVDAAPAYSCPSCMLKVQWNTSSTADSTPWIAGSLKLMNTGSAPIPLSGVTVRYWLREAMAESMVVECYYWNDGTGGNNCARPSGAATNEYTNLTVRIGSAGELRYVELGFLAGAGELSPGGAAPGQLELSLHLPSYEMMIQSDDPSFDAALTAPSTSMLFDAPKITAYLGGELSWGVEP